MKLPYILLNPVLMRTSAWHNFTISDNPVYLCSCPGAWPQINCTSHPWEEEWPRAMPYPWCKSREAPLVPALPITLHQHSSTSSSRLSPAGGPDPSPEHSTPNPSEEISTMLFLHTGEAKRSPHPWLSCCHRPAVPSPLKTRCVKLQGLWRNRRDQLVVEDTGRHPPHWNLTQALVITGSLCSDLWGEVPWTSFCLLLMPNLFSVTSVAKSEHQFSEI